MDPLCKGRGSESDDKEERTHDGVGGWLRRGVEAAQDDRRLQVNLMDWPMV